MVDFSEPRWRLEARVKRPMDMHALPREEAERMVKYVIETKEGPHEEEKCF